MSAYLNAGMLFYGLIRCGVYRPAKGWMLYFAQLVFANAAMAAVLWYLAADMSFWLDWSVMERAGQTAMLVCSGVLVYAVALLTGGVRPRHFRH